MMKIYDMFTSATGKLKHPKVILDDKLDTKIMFRLCTDSSYYYYGTIIVTSYDKTIFYGHIRHDGKFVTTSKVTKEVCNLVNEFVMNPEAVTKAYGFRTGNCCFCFKKLTTKGSLEVGYGPVCAEKFNLSWGKTIRDFIEYPWTCCNKAIIIDPINKQYICNQCFSDDDYSWTCCKNAVILDAVNHQFTCTTCAFDFD